MQWYEQSQPINQTHLYFIDSECEAGCVLKHLSTQNNLYLIQHIQHITLTGKQLIWRHLRSKKSAVGDYQAAALSLFIMKCFEKLEDQRVKHYQLDYIWRN